MYGTPSSELILHAARYRWAWTVKHQSLTFWSLCKFDICVLTLQIAVCLGTEAFQDWQLTQNVLAGGSGPRPANCDSILAGQPGRAPGGWCQSGPGDSTGWGVQFSPRLFCYSAVTSTRPGRAGVVVKGARCSRRWTRTTSGGSQHGAGHLPTLSPWSETVGSCTVNWEAIAPKEEPHRRQWRRTRET